MRHKCRALMEVRTVEQHGHQTGGQARTHYERIKLACVYDSDNPDDWAFSAATPVGELWFDLTNRQLMGTFAPGQQLYVELVPRELQPAAVA